jgi:putative peptidoglycan lipid II flippase
LLFAFPLPHWIGISQKWGVAGLTASAGIAAWVEFFFLRRKLERRIGAVDFSPNFVSKLWISATLAAGVAFAAKHSIPYFVRSGSHPVLSGILILAPYGMLYLLLTGLFGVPQAKSLLRRIRR